MQITQGKRRFNSGSRTLVHKFGENAGLAANSFESVWSAGGVYPWSAFSSAQILYAKSSGVGSDTGNLEIQGLDESYHIQTETITLTNGIPVATTKEFLRVFRLRYSDTVDNAGTITVHTGSGTGTVVGQIEEGEGSSAMALYTIPAGFTGYLVDYTISSAKGTNASVRIKCRKEGEAFQTISFNETFQNSFRQEFPEPLVIPSKSDLDAIAKGSSSNGGLVITFNLYIEKNRVN